MKANQTRQNGRNYKKALCGYAAMGAVMILGASGGSAAGSSGSGD